MHPVRLQFSGLRSYRRPTEICFGDLDLFAIIGDTGAGKSTIIEALCFALYGRKSWSGSSTKVEDLIADGEQVLRIEFDFVADGREWRVTRARRRSGASPVNKLVSLPAEAPEADGAQPVTDRVTELLGLNLQQFTRAVVMPQGRFDELLRASETERNTILTSILGHGDMELVAKHATSLRDEVRPVTGRYREWRRHLPDDPPAEEASALQELQVATDKHTALTNAIDALAEPTDLRDRVLNARSRLQHASDSVPSLDEDPVAILEDCRQRGEALLVEQAAQHELRREAQAQREQLKANIGDALAGFGSAVDLQVAAQRVQESANAFPTDCQAHEGAASALAALQDGAPPEEIDPKLGTAVAEATARSAAAQEELDTAKTALEEARRSWNDYQQALARVRQRAKEMKDADAEVDQAGQELARAASAEVAAQQQLSTVKAHVREVERANQVAAIAAGHGPGEDCPVCARPLPEDFTAPSNSNLDAATAAVAEARIESERAAAKKRDAQTAHDRAVLSRDHAGTDHQSATERLSECTGSAIELGVDTEAADEFTATAELRAKREASTENVHDATEREQQARDALTRAESELTAARNRHAEQLQLAERTLSKTTAAVGLHHSRVRSLPEEWIPEDLDRPEAQLTSELLQELAERLQGAADRISQMESANNTQIQLIDDTNERLAEIAAAISDEVAQPSQAALARVNRVLDRASELTDAMLSASELCHREFEVDNGSLGLAPATPAPEDLAAVVALVHHRLVRMRSRQAAAASLIEDLDEVLSGATDQISDILKKAGVEAVDALHAAAGEASSIVAQATKQLHRAEDAVQEASAVDEVLAIAMPLLANLEVLCTALGKREFVDHLLGLREAELLAEASRRLRDITGDRFGFVEDFRVANIASGQIRSPDALSGGERFQASLALALALVEIASRGGGRLDAVFVDEGFGSLDSNALDVALDTLGKVAGAGKTVALISHLRSVAEYVDTVMLVTRDDVHGSRMRTLSEDERDRLLADDIRSGLTA